MLLTEQHCTSTQGFALTNTPQFADIGDDDRVAARQQADDLAPFQIDDNGVHRASTQPAHQRDFILREHTRQATGGARWKIAATCREIQQNRGDDAPGIARA